MQTRTTNRTKEAARRAAPPNEEIRNRSLPTGQVLVGDALERLRELPSASIDTVVTSPPYFRLRDYGVTGQIGTELSIDEWVARLRAVLVEVARVLKPEGTLWLNLGDTYARRHAHGAEPKSLLLGPERLILALVREDGWRLRNKIIWAKPNPMPAPVADRLSGTWEPLYLLARSSRYYFDLDAIRVPARSQLRRPSRTKGGPKYSLAPRQRPNWAGPYTGTNSGLARMKARGQTAHPLGKNPGDVWTLATAAYRGAHFAVFPEALAERPLLAACPERVCVTCGAAWQRAAAAQHLGNTAIRGALGKSCGCSDATWQPGVVLDPFFGAGTVGVVAERLGRRWLGIELNPQFAQLAQERITSRHEIRRTA